MPPEIDPNTDLRSDLEAAITAAETPEGEGTPPEELNAAPGDVLDPPEGEQTPAEGEVKPEGEQKPEGEVKPEGEQKPEGETAPPEGEKPPATGKYEKAPGTWSPEAREEWGKLSPKVQAEVWKRERDASRAMTISTEARKFQSEFSNMIQPYLGFIAAENSNPLQAVNYMMRTGAILRVGTAEQKAQTVAQVIKQFGVDLEMLDSLMAGEAPQNNPQAAVREIIQRELQPVMQLVNHQRQNQFQADQQLEQEVATELEQFANDHEFYWDVKDDMTVMMEVASRLGRPMTLTQAYERATMESEPVRRVIEARRARKNALEATQRANAARRNATSISPSSNTSVVTPAKGGSIRDDIVAAIDAQQGR